MRRHGPGQFRGGRGGAKNGGLTLSPGGPHESDNFHRGLSDGMNHITKNILNLRNMGGDFMGGSGGNLNSNHENIPLGSMGNGGGMMNE